MSRAVWPDGDPEWHVQYVQSLRGLSVLGRDDSHPRRADLSAAVCSAAVDGDRSSYRACISKI